MFSLENAKWATQQRQMNLDFNFDLMKKFMDLKKMGVSNTDIHVLMPEVDIQVLIPEMSAGWEEWSWEEWR
jgi:hypothetical protein